MSQIGNCISQEKRHQKKLKKKRKKEWEKRCKYKCKQTNKSRGKDVKKSIDFAGFLRRFTLLETTLEFAILST